MAALTSANVDGGMFENVRALLFNVTFKADFLTGSGRSNLMPVDAAVGLMAIGALHRPFLHTVVVGLRKVGLLLSVASHA